MAAYKQLVAPRKGTQAGIGWCLAFAQSFFGAPVKYASAWEAYQATARKQTGALPTGAAVLVWFSHWGTYQGRYDNWGHVVVYVPGDAYYSSPAGKSYGQDRYQTIGAIEKAFNAKYVGWTDNINGLRVAEPAALAKNQRQAFPGGRENDVRRRAQPTTKSKDLGDPVPAGVVGTFDGWIKGESVSGNNVWFRGKSSQNWFWSGGFTSRATTGLTDLNPKAPTVGADQRQVHAGAPANNVRIRKAATTSSSIVKEVLAGTIVKPEGWVKGEKYNGNDVWYKVAGGYAWAGAFTKSDKSGLKDLTPVTPKPEPEPVQPDYVAFEAFHPVVTKVLPAHTNNYEVGRFPEKQTEVVLHDFGTDGRDTFAGTQSWFRNGAADASAHFVVSGDEIVQMVSLQDRAYHAGPEGNNRVGIEIDPAVGRLDDTDPLKVKTIASVQRLLKALGEHYGNELIRRKHPDFMATQCGDDIDLDDYPIQVPSMPDTSALAVLMQQLIDLLKSIFRVGNTA